MKYQENLAVYVSGLWTEFAEFFSISSTWHRCQAPSTAYSGSIADKAADFGVSIGRHQTSAGACALILDLGFWGVPGCQVSLSSTTGRRICCLDVKRNQRLKTAMLKMGPCADGVLADHDWNSSRPFRPGMFDFDLLLFTLCSTSHSHRNCIRSLMVFVKQKLHCPVSPVGPRCRWPSPSATPWNLATSRFLGLGRAWQGFSRLKDGSTSLGVEIKSMSSQMKFSLPSASMSSGEEAIFKRFNLAWC